VGRTRFRAERPLELLALTACQTAAGDERAALGLAGVALRAGARSALATLWSVNDEAALQLVSRFYRELGAGATRAQALQRAQIELLRGRAFDHPGYWSAFLLISSWL
jgi:CHAT domain-containing protein